MAITRPELAAFRQRRRLHYDTENKARLSLVRDAMLTKPESEWSKAFRLRKEKQMLKTLIVAAMLVLLSVAASAQTLVVHVTQSRETGEWTERAVLKLCPMRTTKKGPDGKAITMVAVAASKHCPDAKTETKKENK
jgi:hypothetical protein